MFRGREQSRPELGFRLLQRLAEDITELGYVESSPKQDGRNMVMVLAPTKKKADARAEQRRRRELSSTPAPDEATGTATDTMTDTATVTATAPEPSAASAGSACRQRPGRRPDAYGARGAAAPPPTRTTHPDRRVGRVGLTPTARVARPPVRGASITPKELSAPRRGSPCRR
jgi:translation initiation factor IF-3